MKKMIMAVGILVLSANLANAGVLKLAYKGSKYAATKSYQGLKHAGHFAKKVLY